MALVSESLAVMIPTNKNLKRNKRNSHLVQTKSDSPNNSPVHALRSAAECGNARSSDDLSELAFRMELEYIQTDMNELKERMVNSYIGNLAPKRKGSYKIGGLETSLSETILSSSAFRKPIDKAGADKVFPTDLPILWAAVVELR